MSFRVWIGIEHEIRGGEKYEEMDSPGSSVADFRTYNQAYNYAAELNQIGSQYQTTKELQKINEQFSHLLALEEFISLTRSLVKAWQDGDLALEVNRLRTWADEVEAQL